MTFNHVIECGACLGRGGFTDTHPHNPSGAEWDCGACDGKGVVECDGGCADCLEEESVTCH